MTIDEFLKQAAARYGALMQTALWAGERVGESRFVAAAQASARDVTRLLAIIEAQRAELEKAQAGIDRVCSADDIEAGLVFIAMWRDGFGGNAAIARRFEAGEL